MKKVKTSVALLCTFVISVSTTVLDNTVYKEKSVILTAENDIVDIHIPRSADFVFIVQKNLQEDVYKGIISMKNEFDKSPAKVLDNGKCVASDNKTVYFGANDGIYIFNAKNNKTEKYGNLTIDVNDIEKHTTEDIIYIITNNKLKKVTEKGTRLETMESFNNVQEVVLDTDNNVYLYEKNTDGQIHYKTKVIVNETVIDFKDLPKESSQIKLTRSFAFSEGALLILDRKIYRIFPNGTSVYINYSFESAPTTYFLDTGFIQLIGHEKKLYLINTFDLVLTGFRDFIENISS